MNEEISAAKAPLEFDPAGPLAGIRVVALEQSVAGPIASRILADMGADVIKVEPPHGDFSRQWDSHVHGYSSHFTWLSRRKRSIALNLHEAEQRAIFERLLATADVLIFNPTVAAARRLGLTPERLRRDHPRLVACQISGYGRTGETSGRKAYDMLLQAEAGLLSLTGDDAGPVRVGVSIADIGTGIYASTLILGALYERPRTSVGRFIDLSMFEAMTEFVGPNLTAYANSGVRYMRNRNRHHNIVPYGIFECRDGYISIAVEQDSEWQVFCNVVLQRADLAKRTEFATNERRVARRSEVEAEIEREMAARTRLEWQERLDGAALGYGIINDIAGVWNHQIETDLELHGSTLMPDGTSASVPVSPAERAFGQVTASEVPSLDQHRAEIMSELNQELVG